MMNRDKLVQTYIMRQKELATIQERFNKLQNEMDDKKKLFNRTEQQIKNLECIAHKVGEVH
jgi:ribosomal 50S subunit-associated protein YjgA (DUF615 family)